MLDQSREAEVRQERFARGIEEDVVGFDVSMQDPALVGEMECPRDFGGKLCGPGRVEPDVRAVRHGRSSLQQFHAEVRMAVVLPDLVDRDDVGMVERGGGFRLGAETFDEIRRREGAAQGDLHRDPAAETSLASLEHQAHSAARDFLREFVVAKNSARGRARGARSEGVV